MTQQGSAQGRPRDTGIDERATAAVLFLLAKAPYNQLTLEAIAAQAQTSKPALRRRWQSMPGVVIHALIATLGSSPTPDTGCVHCDLTEGISSLARSFADSPLARALPGLMSDVANEPELHETFMNDYFEPRRASTRRVLESAILRGELRQTLDMELALDMLAAPLYHRVFFGHQPITTDVAEATVMAVLRGIATDTWPGHREI
ncbi:TetR-like C-terminal domain-containing protein [Arthrobacter sp. PAMC 25486]|uniref:TetR-like C-terminal domain-containing protein n=1 Tax=Arthrobacter sp. PAMC 25486 TaxID=1494608 RepID=UPI000570A756|nr:TetR-like C-terminal domain-containing protein [Arthrobacter sp. PAMC 25486]